MLNANYKPGEACKREQMDSSRVKRGGNAGNFSTGPKRQEGLETHQVAAGAQIKSALVEL